MYGKSFLKEDSQYDSINGQKFIKLYNRVISNYPNEKNLYNDLRLKLFTYKSQEQSSKFPINILNKTEYPNLIDLIHKLDNANALINKHKGVKININPDILGIPIVYHNKEKNITVYRADTIYQSIKLGQGTNFCISANNLNPKDYESGNLYFRYKYDLISGKQIATIYFVHNPNQIDKYKILAIDYHKNGGFLYTDTDNRDSEYYSYEDMVNNTFQSTDSDTSETINNKTSPDLTIIPKEVFKWVNQPISNFSKENLNLLIKLQPEVINFMNKPEFIINTNPKAIQFLENPSEELKQLAVSKNGDLISYIKNPSEEIQIIAVKQDAYHIIDIKSPSELVQLAAVEQNPTVINHIENPTEKAKILAVSLSPYLFIKMENPSLEVLKTAIKTNGYYIKDIENPSEELKRLAVEQDFHNIEYIKNPSEELKKIAIKQNGIVLKLKYKYIDNASEDLKKFAIETDPFNYNFIDNPSAELTKLYNEIIKKKYSY